MYGPCERNHIQSHESITGVQACGSPKILREDFHRGEVRSGQRLSLAQIPRDGMYIAGNIFEKKFNIKSYCEAVHYDGLNPLSQKYQQENQRTHSPYRARI